MNLISVDSIPVIYRFNDNDDLLYILMKGLNMAGIYYGNYKALVDRGRGEREQVWLSYPCAQASRVM